MVCLSGKQVSEIMRGGPFSKANLYKYPAEVPLFPIDPNHRAIKRNVINFLFLPPSPLGFFEGCYKVNFSVKPSWTWSKPARSFPVPCNLWNPRLVSSFQTELFNCPICHCVSYCSQSHQAEDREEHAKSCELLRVCLEDHQMEMIMGCHLTDPSWTLGSNSKDRRLGRGFQPRAMTMWANSLNEPILWSHFEGWASVRMPPFTSCWWRDLADEDQNLSLKTQFGWDQRTLFQTVKCHHTSFETP